MPRRAIIAAVASLLASLLLACSSGEADVSEASPLSDDAVRSLTLPSSVTVSGEAPLEDGSYQEEAGQGGSASLASVTLTDTARGDLDADGDEDVVVIVVESAGGSGSFYGLWAILNEDGQPTIRGDSITLGDRIQVRRLAVEDDGLVVLEASVHRADDPLCCPTLEETRRYRLDETLLDVED